jgi:hypothetical protein
LELGAKLLSGIECRGLRERAIESPHLRLCICEATSGQDYRNTMSDKSSRDTLTKISVATKDEDATCHDGRR